jgi:hypothetical protein
MRPRPPLVPLLLVAIGSAGVAGVARAQAPGAAEGAVAAPATSLAGLEFMAGCWRSGDSGRYFEEVYTRPTANMMLGVSLFVRDGRAVSHELTRVEVVGSRVVLTPYPGGERSPHGFVLTSLRDGEALFEAPEHDYPKRILYRRNADGSRTARIDGGPDDTEGREWRFVATPCPDEAEAPPKP